MPEKISLIGQRSGKLRIVAEAPSRIVSGVRRIFYICECDCGKTVEIKAGSLSENSLRRVKSCGCGVGESARERMTTHGQHETRTYGSWVHAKARCSDPNKEQAKDYILRGIQMCERWKESYPAFVEDLGERPIGMTIDRINVDGHYSCGKCPQCVENGWPPNCKWSTTKEQRRNARNTRVVELNGFKGCFSDAATHFDIPIGVAASRFRYGWTYEEIFTTSVRKRIKPTH